MTRRLFGIGTSRTIRPHWLLHELGLPYETRAILPRTEGMQDPDLLALSQRGKIPFLQDGDITLGESGAILFYLADAYRDRGDFAPERGTAARARFDDLCCFILMELDATALYVLRRHEGLPDEYGAAPTACEAARGYFQRQVGFLEQTLADGRPHLLGEPFSAADILLASCLAWANHVGIGSSETLERYAAGLRARPAFAEAFAINFPPGALEAVQPASTSR
ncbi:MAG: glutathione S-transferase family protein [Myxococcota bacterium]